ncbi:hypothetical protein AMTRI_Chr07g27710 [Amborella trichopoda]
MAFFALISMIGILNIASCLVNFSLLEALAKRFNYQINTFFLPTSKTTPTLEEFARVFGLSLAGIAYEPSTATDDHFIMGARMLGAANSSHSQWVDIELLVRNQVRSRATEQIYNFLFFPYSFSPCLLGASGLHHCSDHVGRHLPRSS